MKPRIRCSELDRVLSCPGSRTLNAIVAPRQGDDGVVGTMIHHEISWRLVNELSAVQPDGGLPPLKGVPVGYKIPSYTAWIVDWAFRQVAENTPNPYALEVEPELEWEFDSWVLTGHLDVASTSPDGKVALDWDWKTGIIPVDPAEVNEQVAGYIALRRMNYGIESATFTIGQPWNSEDDGYERLSAVSVHGAESLDALVTTLDHRVRNALERDMELSTGRQCKWCCGLSCPAIQALLHSMKMRLTPEILAGIRATPDDALLVDLVAEARTLNRPLEDAEDMLKARLEAAPVLTGASGREVRIKTSSGGFHVTNPFGIFSWLKTMMSDEQLAAALSYPGGRIKDQIAKAMGIPQSGKAPMTAKSVFEGGAAPFIEKTEKKQLIFT